jgi:hypothetical protein
MDMAIYITVKDAHINNNIRDAPMSEDGKPLFSPPDELMKSSQDECCREKLET